jgi:hypothetical protein
MKRYWFEFDFSNYDNPPYGLIMGCGATGYEYNDVIQLLKDRQIVIPVRLEYFLGCSYS